MLIKKYILCVYFLFSGIILLQAQKPKVKNDPTHDDKLIHFGFSLGINYMDYHIEHRQLAQQDRVYVGMKEKSPGINIHAIANLRLAENFDLRTLPGISFGERYIYFQQMTDSGLVSLLEDKNYKVNSSYLEFPILLKYKSKRLNNFRPYLIGGGNLRYDLSIKKEYDIKDQLLMIAPLDIYAEIGFGMDFYLTFFKFATEIKYSIGLSNILLRSDRKGELPPEFAPYTNYIDKINSHMVILLFHFE
jgi:hypothetical protein